MERYRNKIQKVPIDRVVKVRPEIGVPIAEKLTYVQDSELAELFANLLACASDADVCNLAHPSFPNLISNLAPDEARLLRQFGREGGSVAFVEGNITKRNSRSFITVYKTFLDVHSETGISHPSNVPAYISNLDGLGLVSVHGDLSIDDENLYALLEERLRTRAATDYPSVERTRLQVQRGGIEVTQLGQLFLRACSR